MLVWGMNIINFNRHRERQRYRQRKKQAPSGEPDVELDPRKLGSGPESESDAQPLSHPGIPHLGNLKKKKYRYHALPQAN